VGSCGEVLKVAPHDSV